MHLDNAQGVLRHLVSEIQGCADERELCDRALSLLQLSEPRAVFGALGTLARAAEADGRRSSGDDSPPHAAAGAAGAARLPVRRVDHVAVRGASLGVVQDIQRVLQVSAGRLSFAHILHDSAHGVENWMIDSEVTDGCGDPATPLPNPASTRPALSRR